jgi:hypothetical protein
MLSFISKKQIVLERRKRLKKKRERRKGKAPCGTSATTTFNMLPIYLLKRTDRRKVR